MKSRLKQFSTKYGKSYKSVENAEKAVNKFMEKAKTQFGPEFQNLTLRWIPTVASDDPSRIKVTFILSKDLLNSGFQAVWLVEEGWSVVG